MRPVGVAVIGFVYVLSLGMWFVDATLFSEDPAMRAGGLDGGPLGAALPGEDGPGLLRGGAGSGADALPPAWNALELLAGTYAFGVLELAGAHPNLVVVLKAIFPLVAALTVLHYVAGRRRR